jgi:hypothetical protein
MGGIQLQETTAEPVAHPRPLEAAIVATFTLVSSFAVLFIVFQLITGNSLASRDYISYWATAKQLIHKANPYGAHAILLQENEAGYLLTNKPLLMRNPPNALFITLPLGLLSARTGCMVWSALLLLCLCCSVLLLRKLHPLPVSQVHWLGLCFAPSLGCLLTGQTGIFALFGLTMFVYFHRLRPGVAGISLALCAFKPHLFLPFAAGLIVLIAAQKSYRILVGAIFALVASFAIAFYLDHSIWMHYEQMLRTDAIEHEFVPTLSVLLRLALKPNAFWLQLVPSAIASGWAAWFAWKHREDWDWVTHGSILALVSVLVAPYSWFTDQAVVWPALFSGMYRSTQSARMRLLCLMGAVTAQMLRARSMHSEFYLFTSLAWFAWYVVTAHRNTQTID